jgi:hypothetical protein
MSIDPDFVLSSATRGLVRHSRQDTLCIKVGDTEIDLRDNAASQSGDRVA